MFSLPSLVTFLDMDIAVVQGAIDKPQAIITLTDDTPQFHKSFGDYITDRARSNELYISQSQAHAVLALRCFCALGSGNRDCDDVYYGARNIKDHCAAADPTILTARLSDARPGHILPPKTCITHSPFCNI